jgi:cysteine desulfurase/selenocysteine lyase
MDWVRRREHELVAYAMERLAQVEGLRILGPSASQRGGVVAFTLEGIHPHDISAILDAEGIAIRAGHHCAQPIHDCFGLVATARASFYFYNTTEEVDRLALALDKVQSVFA